MIMNMGNPVRKIVTYYTVFDKKGDLPPLRLLKNICIVGITK